MQKNKLKILGVMVLFLAILTAFTSPGSRFFEIAKSIEIYAALFKTVNKVYVDEVNPNHLLNTTAEAMLKTLDPYTVYISEDKIEDYRTQSTGQYGGIGASTVRIDGKVFIADVVPNGPAETAGIEIGDEVITASGVNVVGKTNEVLNQLVRGQAKTPIDLGIRKNGSDATVNIEVIRDKITIKNVPYSGKVADGVGYIKFNQFTANGAKNVGKSLKELKKQGITSLILDLRDNPGGLLNEAVGICNLFIPKDELVVQTRGKRPENTTVWKTQFQPMDTKIPVVVLVNSSSASASEIVSGTLQDYDRAVIMGQKTYGKGLVQNVRPLSYNAQLKVTIAKYYTPSGRCIQALDYAHRNPNGSVGKIPDSLKTAYTTKAGRIVYDGGGVDPDTILVPKNWNPLVRSLLQEGYIYLYANHYKLQHSSITAPKQFKLSDNDFEDFLHWIKTQNFTFKSALEQKLNRLNTIAEADPSVDSTVFSKIVQVTKMAQQPLQEALLTNKKDIKEVLAAEIVLRYYNTHGSIENTLANDVEVQQAIAVLKDRVTYTKLLTNPK